MTVYLVTIPGTLLTELTPEARTQLVSALRPADPRGTELGVAEDLDILSFYSGSSAFSLHVEVEASDTSSAVDKARDLASSALHGAGLDSGTAPLGDPVITGIAGE
ncbi:MULTISPECIES: hypothetical protein [unclassified Streptomyces]|uniref:hypothetical protein n=1 Tax=unclassified Streptomyces TaxID=2593676 RepID=UPI002E37AD8B|nr:MULTISPECIES: hypothetical protein [unclassified Streptomyces]WUC63378.1 hypothetical protein OG861_03635 [Streptomyces sp. NBC_00539]